MTSIKTTYSRNLKVRALVDFFLSNNNSLIDVNELKKHVPDLRIGKTRLLEKTIAGVNLCSDVYDQFTGEAPIYYGNRLSSDQLRYYLRDTGSKNRTVVGQVQSGKTQAIIDIAMKYRSMGQSVVIMVQNYNAHVKQLISRLSITPIVGKQRNADYAKYLHIDASGYELFVVKRSKSDLSPIAEYLAENFDHLTDFVFIIDESDFNDSGTNAQCQEFVTVIKECANVVWNVTATAILTLTKEEIMSDNVIILSPPDNYRGIESFQFDYLPEPNVRIGHNQDEDVTETDVNLIPYINRLLDTPVFNTEGQLHPVISLIVTTSVIDVMTRACQHVYSLYSTHPGLAVVSFNTELSVFSSTIDKMTRSFLNTTYKSNISGLLSWFQQQGVEKFSHILIFAGKMADRGISFSSDFKFSRYHLTHEYLSFPKTSFQDGLIQNCRLAGCFDDDIPLTLTLYDPNRLLLKSIRAQTELITEAQRQKEMLMREAMPMTPINATDIPDSLSVCKAVGRLPCSVVYNISADDAKVNLECIVKTYKTRTTIIHKLIVLFVELNNEPYTIENLKLELELPNFDITKYDRYTEGRRAGRRVLTRVSKTDYRLCDDVYNLFKKL